jgi:(p)ppGpp synthase/HD superfamily hydrolase
MMIPNSRVGVTISGFSPYNDPQAFEEEHMDVFERAMEFARRAHQGQLRKTGNIPFILHPFEVAAIVATMTDDREVLAAALLHDTVEDTQVTPEEVLENFGPRVAQLVADETENKRRDVPSEDSWRVRKEESLANLASHADDEAVLQLWLADKLSNMRSFYRLSCERGDDMWDAFNMQDTDLQGWYYREVLRLTAPLADTAAWREYCWLVSQVFGEEQL